MKSLGSIAALLFLALSPLQGQVIQEDFDGTSLGPMWEAYPSAGSISVSGGLLHLSIPNLGTQLIAFPSVRILPGAGTIASPHWIVEARLRWLLTPPLSGGVNGRSEFASAHNPITETGFCTTGQSSIFHDCPVYAGYDNTHGLTVYAGTGTTYLAIDDQPHQYRWVSDGVNVKLFMDSVLVVTGTNDGHQPNNFFAGNHCQSAASRWVDMEVDWIRMTWNQTVDAPAAASIGTTINYDLGMPASTAYAFDVSTTGTYPGTVYGPASLLIPLNPPFLFQDYGASLPGVFVNFLGSSSPLGIASTAVNVPALPILIGTYLSATFVTLDALAPGGVSAVAYPVTTVITP